MAGRPMPVAVVRHRLARRYVVRVTTDGVRLTVPRGASIAGGLAFAERQAGWLEREWHRQRERAAPWRAGTSLWFRGERVVLSVAGGRVQLGSHQIETTIGSSTHPRRRETSEPQRARPLASFFDLREIVEPWLRELAEMELPGRCAELSQRCRLSVSRVAVRNQRSRWGACSPKRVITLNWRLIQMPPDVSDYIIFHELMHLKQPNHSRRFWREVDAVCAGWRSAERWLRTHGRELI